MLIVGNHHLFTGTECGLLHRVIGTFAVMERRKKTDAGVFPE